MGGVANGGGGSGNRSGRASRDVVATASVAGGDSVTGDATPTPQAQRLPPKPVRLLLRAWWALAAFVGAALIGDLLGIPLANDPSHWEQGVRNQFGALLSLVGSHPIQSAIAALAIAILTSAGYVENKRVRRDEAIAARQAQARATAGELRPNLEDLKDGQAAAIRLGAANLAVGGANLAQGEQILAEVRGARGDMRAVAPRQVPSRGGSVTHRVFISSTDLDLHAHRLKVHEALERVSQFAVDMAQFGAGPGDATSVSKEKVASAEFFVLVVAWRYGFVPAGEARSITYQEYDEAVRLELPIFVYLADPATEADDGPHALFPAATRDPEHAAQLHEFRAMLADSQRHVVDTFTTPEDLAARVGTAVPNYLINHPELLLPVTPGVSAIAGLPRTDLVGRDEEIETLMERLRAGQASGVFAVQGIAGVGKTALTAEVVARLAEDQETFPGRAAWIPCEGLTGAEGLAQLWGDVARALGYAQVAEQADPEVRRRALSAALAERPRTLLALDNVEPGLTADAVLDTLSVAGHTTLLLTAREAILPARLQPLVLESLTPPDAVTLFTRILAQNRVALGPEAGPQLERIVTALGGLPLAIELTAGYMAVQGLTMNDIEKELEQDGINAQALKPGPGSDPRRGVAKRFDRSYAALTPSQRLLYAGLALLVGPSFPRTAALALAEEAIRLAYEAMGETAQSGDEATPEGDVRALVELRLAEPLAAESGPRLRLHPLLRDYAAAQLKRLPADTADRLGDALVAYWLAYARAHLGFEGMDALEAEAPGLMGAVEWAHEHERFHDGLDLARALLRAWDTRGRRNDEIRLYTFSVEAARTRGDLAAERWAIHQLSVTYAQTGRLAEARAGYARALALAQQLGDPAAERDEVHSLAVLDAKTGRLAEARAGFARALALARQLGDPAAEQAEVRELALLDQQTGKLDQARSGYLHALELARQLQDPAGERLLIHDLAVVDGMTGRLAEAQAGYARALALARELGDPAAERAEVHELAVLEDNSGNYDAARPLYQRALELARQLGDPAAEATELMNFGLFLCEHEEAARGRPMIEDSVRLCERLGDPYGIGKGHEFLARADTYEGNRDAAIAHYREALRLFAQVESPDAEDVRAALRQLGVEA